MKLSTLVDRIVNLHDWWARGALAIVFGWFGVLKLLGLSPVAMLIIPLFEKLAPFLVPYAMIVLGVGEIALAIGFLVPRFTKWVVLLTVLHLLGTFLTLILTPDLTWSSFLVPTFAGEFVIKNVVLIALGIEILMNNRVSLKRSNSNL